MDCFLVYSGLPFFWFSHWLLLRSSRIIPLCGFPYYSHHCIHWRHPTALQTVLAVLHRVHHRYFGSNHILLVLCASVSPAFLYIFQGLISLSSFIAEDQGVLDPKPPSYLEAQSSETGQEYKQDAKAEVAKVPDAEQNVWCRPDSYEYLTKKSIYPFFCFTVFVSGIPKRLNESSMFVANTKKNSFN